jgi:hypothetical protein
MRAVSASVSPEGRRLASAERWALAVAGRAALIRVFTAAL